MNMLRHKLKWFHDKDRYTQIAVLLTPAHFLLVYASGRVSNESVQIAMFVAAFYLYMAWIVVGFLSMFRLALARVQNWRKKSDDRRQRDSAEAGGA